MAANTASFRRLPDLQITEEEWDQPLPLFAEAAGAFSNGLKCATPCYRVEDSYANKLSAQRDIAHMNSCYAENLSPC